MPTITRKHRANLTETVEIALAEDEYIPTQGDRKRGLNTRKQARIVGYHLEFAWIAAAERWDLIEPQSQIAVQQKRNDDTWGAPAPRIISYDAGPALESNYAPVNNPTVSW
jgi:hypothetical protein